MREDSQVDIPAPIPAGVIEYCKATSIQVTRMNGVRNIDNKRLVRYEGSRPALEDLIDRFFDPEYLREIYPEQQN